MSSNKVLLYHLINRNDTLACHTCQLSFKTTLKCINKFLDNHTVLHLALSSKDAPVLWKLCTPIAWNYSKSKNVVKRVSGVDAFNPTFITIFCDQVILALLLCSCQSWAEL